MAKVSKKQNSKATSQATKAKATKAKATDTTAFRATAPSGKTFDKSFPTSRKPVAAVLVSLYAPKQPHDKSWQVLCWTSKEAKARADFARVTRLYIDPKNGAHVQRRYREVVLVDDLKVIKAVETPEDRSIFRIQKIAQGRYVAKAKKTEAITEAITEAKPKKTKKTRKLKAAK